MADDGSVRIAAWGFISRKRDPRGLNLTVFPDITLRVAMHYLTKPEFNIHKFTALDIMR
jgi:hypothetical protein